MEDSTIHTGSQVSEDGGHSSTQKAGRDAGRAISTAGGTLRPIKKVVVAIHGIGDQYRNATIRSVVTRFGRHFDHPMSVPLGSFYSESGQVSAFRLKSPPAVPSPLDEIGFVEVYWADIPRGLQKEGFTIEETKAWARTVVDRVRARYGVEVKDRFQLEGRDYGTAATVLEEMIETIQILSNLLHIAEKAGVLKFELDDLLTNYLGDVQIVADFEKFRFQILEVFRKVLDGVWEGLRERQRDEMPEIYIVAHSEGTVVSFMGLLQAMSLPAPGQPIPPKRAAWIDHVRGFMTIGSPIDKHLILWPDIWEAFSKPGPAPKLGKIKWRNYYDHGDPVGFELETAREWMRDSDHRWDAAFEFDGPDSEGNPKHDFGFSRYLLPGAAHNDYWGDKSVFGHFLQTVMGLPSTNHGDDFQHPPRTRWWTRVGCYVLPYLLTLGLLGIGVFTFHKVLSGYLEPEVPPAWARGLFPDPKTLAAVADSSDLLRPKNVAGITALLAGVTLACRIPRLARRAIWRWIAVGLLLIGGGLYVELVTPRERCWLGLVRVPAGMRDPDATFATITTFLFCLVTITLATLGWKLKRMPDWLKPLVSGLRPLMIPGGLFIAGLVGFRLQLDQDNDKVLWPLLLAGVAFLYLWWLATLIFDLVFVWHRYMRHSVIQRELLKLCPAREQRESESMSNFVSEKADPVEA